MVGIIPVISGKSTSPDPRDKIIIKDIEFHIEKNSSEKVYIRLNRFAIPKLIALEGEKPRIAIDISNVSLLHEHNKILVDGYLIKWIRTHYHRNTETLRIVLDLNSAEDYIANPTYYKAENMYCIEIGHTSF